MAGFSRLFLRQLLRGEARARLGPGFTRGNRETTELVNDYGERVGLIKDSNRGDNIFAWIVARASLHASATACRWAWALEEIRDQRVPEARSPGKLRRC